MIRWYRCKIIIIKSFICLFILIGIGINFKFFKYQNPNHDFYSKNCLSQIFAFLYFVSFADHKFLAGFLLVTQTTFQILFSSLKINLVLRLLYPALRFFLLAKVILLVQVSLSLFHWLWYFVDKNRNRYLFQQSHYQFDSFNPDYHWVMSLRIFNGIV